MNVYEASEALEELKINGSTAELVTDPSLFLFPPEDDGNETEEDDGGDITGVPDNLSPDQLLSRAEVELGEIRRVVIRYVLRFYIAAFETIF